MPELRPDEVGRVAVLAGGDSMEREVSLRSGDGVIEALKRKGFDTVAIDPDDDLIAQLRDEKADAVFNVLHGGKGEDGTIQGVLEVAGIRYTGSGVLASALTMNKVQSKRIFRATDIPTPAYHVIDPEQDIGKQCRYAANFMKLPAVCKPHDQGSSIGVSIARHLEEMIGACEALVEKYGGAFVERYLEGPEVTVGILGTGGDVRALPLLELRPQNEFYDYEAKYTEGMTEFVIPAEVDAMATRMAQQVGIRAHKVLGCHGWSRVDMHIDGEGMPQVHEVNSIPGMTPLSDVPAQVAADGMSYDDLVVEILASAFAERP